MLNDNYGRTASDLRVSLTDRCNLRCTYCMPAEGLDWLPSPNLLTDDEIVRLIRIGVTRHGIRSIRFTGGEPLLRRGLVDIVRRVRELGPELDLSLTTNGVGLARVAEALAQSGLDRVNVSLDSIRPEVFKTLTRRHRLEHVVEQRVDGFGVDHGRGGRTSTDRQEGVHVGGHPLGQGVAGELFDQPRDLRVEELLARRHGAKPRAGPVRTISRHLDAG